MNVKVYGFKFGDKTIPPQMSRTSVFEYMSQTAGAALGKSYRYGAKKIEIVDDGIKTEWWAGMLLKIRDSKAFTKLTERNGESVLTAETLGENEKLVELSYFIAHPQTGSGLLAHHHQATSITGFSFICRRLFSSYQRLLKKIACAKVTAVERKAISKQFKGELTFEMLSNDTNLKDLVKKLKRVSTVELRLATLQTSKTFLRGIGEHAQTEVIKLMFPPDADVSELAEETDELSRNSNVEDIKVVGFDDKKKRREYFKDQNPLIFDEYDYDKMTANLKLDLKNWAKSIDESVAIRRLIAAASAKTTLHLLKST